ncbi:hypothetical protein PM8797T_16745 [Gimesia maris DSM 8797]|nr:hypothetical protein PM8797T_16745 [Gimesia maris DSM 8797]
MPQKLTSQEINEDTPEIFTKSHSFLFVKIMVLSSLKAYLWWDLSVTFQEPSHLMH